MAAEITSRNIDKEVKGDFLIFISKHQGAKPKILSLHAPGNWKKAEYGGKENKVCKTSASILKIFFQELNKNVPQGWTATLECTHHGPYVEKPCLFIEIGSSEKDWIIKQAGQAIATTIENTLKKINKENQKLPAAIGIGGPHYCPNFNKIQLNSKYAMGHIIPEYIMPINESIIKEAINKTEEKVELAILDWKGMKREQRQELMKILYKLNLKHKRTSEIKK